MTRAAVFLLGIVVGVLLGAACVVLGFQLGQATAAVPSRPAPVSFQPLPRPDIGGVPAAVPPTRHLVDPDADQGDPSPVLASARPAPTESPAEAPLGVSGATGLASWYSVGPGLYAAAGPALRTPGWRGRTVTVCAASCVVVRLVDCGVCSLGIRLRRKRIGNERLPELRNSSKCTRSAHFAGWRSYLGYACSSTSVGRRSWPSALHMAIASLVLMYQAL